MPAQKAALEGLAPVELPGPWPLGMALGMHSEPGDAGPVLTSAGVLLDRFKYGGERRLARLIAQAMAEMLRGRPRFAEVQLVLHVPGSRRRGGVEPPCDLARAIARELRVLCLPRFLAATRHLLSQKDITSWEAKKHNVQGAFRVRRAEFVSGRKVLLVDDVFDSGATLEEVWRALMDAGAREVVVATVTKTHYRRDA
jgi:predicted amidophosphoribosyltransferase